MDGHPDGHGKCGSRLGVFEPWFYRVVSFFKYFLYIFIAQIQKATLHLIWKAVAILIPVRSLNGRKPVLLACSYQVEQG